MDLDFIDHPIIKPPSIEKQLEMIRLDKELYAESVKIQRERIDAAINDPLNCGFEFES